VKGLLEATSETANFSRVSQLLGHRCLGQIKGPVTAPRDHFHPYRCYNINNTNTPQQWRGKINVKATNLTDMSLKNKKEKKSLNITCCTKINFQHFFFPFFSLHGMSLVFIKVRVQISKLPLLSILLREK